jgi:hypothetical protein
LLAKEPDDRKRIPRKLQAEVRRGRYRWIERRRFRSNADQYATLWELALSGQATWAPLEELRRARHDHSRTLR